MNERILLLFPTRGRPWAALAAIVSVFQTAARPDSVTVAILQDDDDRMAVAVRTRATALIDIVTISGQRRRFVEWCNYGFETFSPAGYSWIGWLADDIRFLTPGWDDLVRSHTELLVYGEDGYQNEKLATHPFIRREVPTALGYLVPPTLVHYCADGFNMRLAQALGSISYDPRIKTEHLHPDASKAAVDQTYLDARQFWEADIATFEEIKKTLPQLAEAVRGKLPL